MFNFTYHNPTKIVFGKGTIAELARLAPAGAKVMMTYGGGSIKKNGVYEQVLDALRDRDLLEFGGIEPNPRYETLMKAVELGRAQGVDFLLAVGGGSVLDGTKFVAAAIPFTAGDPWDILSKGARVDRAVPMGAVLTLRGYQIFRVNGRLTDSESRAAARGPRRRLRTAAAPAPSS